MRQRLLTGPTNIEVDIRSKKSRKKKRGGGGDEDENDEDDNEFCLETPRSWDHDGWTTTILSPMMLRTPSQAVLHFVDILQDSELAPVDPTSFLGSSSLSPKRHKKKGKKKKKEDKDSSIEEKKTSKIVEDVVLVKTKKTADLFPETGGSNNSKRRSSSMHALRIDDDDDDDFERDDNINHHKSNEETDGEFKQPKPQASQKSKSKRKESKSNSKIKNEENVSFHIGEEDWDLNTSQMMDRKNNSRYSESSLAIPPSRGSVVSAWTLDSRPGTGWWDQQVNSGNYGSYCGGQSSPTVTAAGIKKLSDTKPSKKVSSNALPTIVTKKPEFSSPPSAEAKNSLETKKRKNARTRAKVFKTECSINSPIFVKISEEPFTEKQQQGEDSEQTEHDNFVKQSLEENSQFKNTIYHFMDGTAAVKMPPSKSQHSPTPLPMATSTLSSSPPPPPPVASTTLVAIAQHNLPLFEEEESCNNNSNKGSRFALAASPPLRMPGKQRSASAEPSEVMRMNTEIMALSTAAFVYRSAQRTAALVPPPAHMFNKAATSRSHQLLLKQLVTGNLHTIDTMQYRPSAMDLLLHNSLSLDNMNGELSKNQPARMPGAALFNKSIGGESEFLSLESRKLPTRFSKFGNRMI